MKSRFYILFTLSVALFGQSCAKKMTEGTVILPGHNSEDAVGILDSIQKNTPYFLSSKIDTRYTDNKQNISFKTSLRMSKDTSIWALFTYAGVPLITNYITKDSIQISNKKEKCYIKDSRNFIARNFKIDLSLADLQNVFLGRPLKYNKLLNYTLHSTNKELIISNIENKRYFLTYFIDKVSKRINSIEYTDQEIKLKISYLDYWIQNQYSIPQNIKIEINASNNNITVDLNVEKIEINQPKEMVVVIPESYEKCN